MTVAQALEQFYTKNELPKNGGINENTFQLKFRFFSLTLPNSQLRKDLIHIHDIQHILYNCDTSWKGESFISGWEVATGLWKQIPVGLMSLWAMGFGLLNYPKEIFNGYKAGLQCHGIVDLQLTKDELLQLSIKELEEKIYKEKPIKMNTFQWVIFSLWVLISELIFFFPLVLLVILYLIF